MKESNIIKQLQKELDIANEKIKCVEPLIKEIANWESKNGSMCWISPDEYEEVCLLIMNAILYSSPRRFVSL